MLRETIREWIQLAIAWWSKDRIRIPKTEGRLLAVVPGDRLLIGERIFQVDQRVEEFEGNRIRLRYRLSENIDENGVDECHCRWTLVHLVESPGFPEVGSRRTFLLDGRYQNEAGTHTFEECDIVLLPRTEKQILK